VAAGSFRAGNQVLLDENGNLTPPQGFSLGVFSERITIGGISFSNIQAIFNAFKSDDDVNIVSTPQILTTDNEEAKIVVAQNIPFQTRTSTTDNDTYNSFEYRDVGKTLKIKPQISKDRKVRLNISLEVSDVASPTNPAGDPLPTTLVRTVETTVVVQDTDTVVIGGLIEENTAKSKQEVPCLGGVPLFRYGFSNVATTERRQNLYVFLTPHVINEPREAEGLYRKKRDEIDRLQGGKIRLYPGEKEDPSPDVRIEHSVIPGEG
jgi:general secretion pathway protein D